MLLLLYVPRGKDREVLVYWWRRLSTVIWEWLLEMFLLYFNSKVSAVVITLVEGDKKRLVVLYEQRLNWVGFRWILCYQQPYSSTYFVDIEIPVARASYTRAQFNAYFKTLKVRYNPDKDDSKIFRKKTREIAPAFQRLQ